MVHCVDLDWIHLDGDLRSPRAFVSSEITRNL